MVGNTYISNVKKTFTFWGSFWISVVGFSVYTDSVTDLNGCKQYIADIKDTG